MAVTERKERPAAEGSTSWTERGESRARKSVCAVERGYAKLIRGFQTLTRAKKSRETRKSGDLAKCRFQATVTARWDGTIPETEREGISRGSSALHDDVAHLSGKDR